MIRVAMVICWLALIVDVVSIAILYRMNPNRPIGGALATLVPFIFALTVFHSEPKRWKTRTAVVLNWFLVAMGVVALFFAADAAQPWVAAVIGSALILGPGVIIVGVERVEKAARAADRPAPVRVAQTPANLAQARWRFVGVGSGLVLLTEVNHLVQNEMPFNETNIAMLFGAALGGAILGWVVWWLWAYIRK